MELVRETGVPGLYLFKNFISKDEESSIVLSVDECEWMTNRSGTRRVQVFGPMHNSNYKITSKSEITPLPEYASDWLVNRVVETVNNQIPSLCEVENYRLGQNKYTALFVNEYFENDGLDYHHDHRTTYRQCIFGVSLLSDSKLYFKRGKKEIGVNVPARSMYVMSGDSRFKWKHGMKPGTLSGPRRISLTFRAVNL